ncbi:hypothetical protein LJC15_00605, partial [Desulfovibrio sp. OttesenSCG-928-G11]|nr:hypothetical protein [Desulfovibrio sp. OttesenSCG-928-G11]
MKVRWKEMLVAFMMAFVLWYGVTGSEKLESQVDVRVDYRGLPQGLVVSSGLVSKVAVRLRAPGGMLRSVAVRDHAFFLDLSKMHKGENVIAVNADDLPFGSGVEVIDVTPARIFLNVDTVVSKSVAVRGAVTGKTPADHMAALSFEPPVAIISGPSALVDIIESIEVRVPIDEQVLPGTTESRRVLTVPQGVDVTPTEVKAALKISVKRKQVKATRTVQVRNLKAGRGKFVRPDKVTISFNAPESQAAKMAGSNAVSAFVELEKQELGSYTLPVRVTLPEGAELLGIDPHQVTVTVEQEQQPAR